MQARERASEAGLCQGGLRILAATIRVRPIETVLSPQSWMIVRRNTALTPTETSISGTTREPMSSLERRPTITEA